MYSATFKGPMLSLASCEIKIAGDRVVGLTKADMSCGLTREPEYGSGPIAIGKAIGQHKAEFSCDQHLQEALVLQKKLNALSGGAGHALVDVNVTFTFTGAGVRVSGTAIPIKAIVLTGVSFNKLKAPPANDGKSIIASWECTVTQPIGWDPGDGNLIYSINPEQFAQSNSIAIGIGGTVSIGG